MPNRSQTRWAIVHSHGYINHGYMTFTRRDCIVAVLANYRSYRAFQDWATLSDAQFWRKLKKFRGFYVSKITLRVVR